MKIEKLHIENYESIRIADIELNEDINIFIGKNNTGKSNVIDAFMFLSDFVTSAAGSVVARGGFKEIVFGKDEGNKITFDLEFTLTDEERSNLFSKLQLDDVISYDEFIKLLSNKIRYFVKFGQDMIPIQEKFYVYSNNKEIIYAEGYWDGGSYINKIIKDLKSGIIDGNWELEGYGGGAPPTPTLQRPSRHRRIGPKEKLLSLMYTFIDSFYHLKPVRTSSGDMDVFGVIKLAPDGSNLPQVLNSIASSNRKLFETIMKSVINIAEEIAEIRAPLKFGKRETYLCITEQPFSFKDTEFLWKRISSGVQELLFLITLLHTTPKGSLLMIEEPEIHLHPEATYKFLSLIEKICEDDSKQILITTHSPMLVDAISFDKIHIVTKQNGATDVKSFKDFTVIEKKLVKQGILKSWLLLPQAKSLPSEKFILVVEDNVKVWGKFIGKSNLFPNPEEIKVIPGKTNGEGGWNEAVKTGSLLKLLKSMGVLSLPFVIVLDSDNKKSGKEEKLREEDLSEKEYHILEKKEIEDYLLDPLAISKLTSRDIKEVTEAIDGTRGGGKEKLGKVFKTLGFKDLDASEDNLKQLLVEHMEDIPEEISSILKGIDKELKQQ